MNSIIENLLPNKYWITLYEACQAKGLHYKTACNKTYLQPNNGIAEGKIGGKKCWRRETVIAWIEKSDKEVAELVSAE